MNIRICKQCGKEVDFDEPWCDHETMEESAWLNMPQFSIHTIIDRDIRQMVEEELRWT